MPDQTQRAAQAAPGAVVVRVRCAGDGEVLELDDTETEDALGLFGVASVGGDLFAAVHEGFRMSVRRLLDVGGCEAIAIRDSANELRVATLTVAVGEGRERVAVFEIGAPLPVSPEPGRLVRLSTLDPALLPEGRRARVVSLMVIHPERLLLQHSPGRILRAWSRAIEVTQNAAGSETVVSPCEFGGLILIGRHEDARLANRVRDAITSRRPGEPSIEFAVGEATGRWPGVLRRAVRAAGYAAETQERYWFAELDENVRFERQERVRDELGQLIGGGALRLEVQPVVDADSGAIVSGEALLRLDHPEFGVVAPGEILGALSGNAQQVELDRWVIIEGARIARRLTAVCPEFRLCVNVTSSLLRSGGVVEFIRKHAAGLPVRGFGIEVSEHDSFTQLNAIAPKLSGLREQGILVALDDFGTGASSLACASLPFDIIKLDRRFVENVSEDPANYGVCIAVTAIGEAVGATVVAEGVETAEQARCLTTLGITHHQGWWYAPAMSVTDLVHRLQ